MLCESCFFFLLWYQYDWLSNFAPYSQPISCKTQLMCVLPRNSPALDSSNTSFFSRSNWFMSKIVVRCDWPIQLLLFGCYETINYKVPLCVSLHDISVQGFQYIRYTSYPRLTWLGSIGRTRLRRLENWYSNTRFQVFTCSRTNWGLEVLLLKRLRGKPEHREKTSLSKEETNKNADPTGRRHWDLNPDHTGGGRVLSPLRHYCSPTPYSHQLLSHFLQRDFYAG